MKKLAILFAVGAALAAPASAGSLEPPEMTAVEIIDDVATSSVSGTAVVLLLGLVIFATAASN